MDAVILISISFVVITNANKVRPVRGQFNDGISLRPMNYLYAFDTLSA